MAEPCATIFGLGGPSLTATEAAFFAEAEPWGFILFARNVADPEQLRRLTGDLRACVGRDAPILIDQEGGRVARLRGPQWQDWPSPLADAARGAESLTLRYRLIAAELIGLGIDVNCMPLLDVPSPDGHQIIGDRALGHDPATVARLGRAVCAGLRAGGVLPVIKHLPGHGRATADSHLALPRVDTPLADLRAVDFAAFAPLAGEALGMTAHVVYAAIDPDQPATLSPACIQAIRHDIGFDGALMTDDLSMQALSGPMAVRAVRAIAAGCDLLLHCNGDPDEMAMIAGVAPRLAGAAAARTARALAGRQAAEAVDLAELALRYHQLVLAGTDV